VTDDPIHTHCVICGEPIPDEWVEVVMVGSAKDIFFAQPSRFFAHEACLKKVSSPGFIWP
jgi:hypothetical protein